MALYTEQQIRAAAVRAGGSTEFGARTTLRKGSEGWRTSFDVFLSHAYLDSQLVLGVKATLEAMDMTVYVDWIDDPALDRETVSAETAARLRQRMQQSKSLIFATSRASVDSKWMPWELGYFDGMRSSERIAIFPLVKTAEGSFAGQEYLGLYPRIQHLRSATSLTATAVVTQGIWQPESKSLRGFVAANESFSKTAYR